MKEEKQYDVVIIGGSYAGLSAAMTLGRGIKNVLIVDNGKPCNQQTPHSHNFLTQDGNTPAAIAELAKTQVMNYPTIKFKNDLVVAAEGENNNFLITLAEGGTITAKKILFSTGVKDKMPAIKGLAECWGISVIHCPYCHGYEYKGQRTGVFANGEMAFEFGRLISNWAAELTIFTNGESTIADANSLQLSNNGIQIVEKELVEIKHTDGYLNELVFADGSTRQLDALYAKLPFEQHCTIPGLMGCKIDEAGYIIVDPLQKTSVAGIYAAGDNTTRMRSVSTAAASGNLAGAMLNNELVAEGFKL